MIIIKPSYDDNGSRLLELISGGNGVSEYVSVEEQVPYRTTSVLAPDGTNVRVAVPRRAIGFDLRSLTK